MCCFVQADSPDFFRDDGLASVVASLQLSVEGKRPGPVSCGAGMTTARLYFEQAVAEACLVTITIHSLDSSPSGGRVLRRVASNPRDVQRVPEVNVWLSSSGFYSPLSLRAGPRRTPQPTTPALEGTALHEYDREHCLSPLALQVAPLPQTPPYPCVRCAGG